MDENGHFKRLAPVGLGDALAVTVFRTGDDPLDELLETARQKFLQPRPAIRQEALDQLWDAWERIKTLEDPAHKKNSIGRMLDKASPEPNFRAALDSEAVELTRIVIGAFKRSQYRRGRRHQGAALGGLCAFYELPGILGSRLVRGRIEYRRHV